MTVKRYEGTSYQLNEGPKFVESVWLMIKLNKLNDAYGNNITK